MRENLKALTSLRFFAAAAIVIHHSTWYFGYGTSLAQAFPLDLGVSFFFVLSGFVLAYAHPSIGSIREAAQFIGARIARIWPVHVAMLLVIVLFLPFPWNAGPVTPGEFPPILTNALLLQSWFHVPSEFFSFNGVAWSISTEMFFYAMFPLLLWNWHKTKWLKLIAAAVLAALCIHHATATGLSLLGDGNTPSIDALVYIFPPARILEFVIGILAADIWCHHRSRLDRTLLATSLQIASIALIAFGVYRLNNFYGGLYERGLVGQAALKWLFASGSSPIFAFTIIAMGLQRGLVVRLLSFKPFVLLGEISFCVYMTHQVWLRILTAHSSVSWLSMPQQYIAYWTLVLGSSYLLWRFVEKPCRRYIVRKLDGLLSDTPSQETTSPQQRA